MSKAKRAKEEKEKKKWKLSHEGSTSLEEMEKKVEEFKKDSEGLKAKEESLKSRKESDKKAEEMEESLEGWKLSKEGYKPFEEMDKKVEDVKELRKRKRKVEKKLEKELPDSRKITLSDHAFERMGEGREEAVGKVISTLSYPKTVESKGKGKYGKEVVMYKKNLGGRDVRVVLARDDEGDMRIITTMLH